MHADAITPTEPLGAVAISPKRHRPSPKLRRVGFRNMSFRGLLSVHSRFGLHGRSITQGDLYQSTSTNLLPPSSLWLLPAERPIGRVGFAPTGNRRLSRHTGIEDFSHIHLTGPATMFACWDQRFDNCPLLVAQVAGIGIACWHVHVLAPWFEEV
jgi:hypothetical protein